MLNGLHGGDQYDLIDQPKLTDQLELIKDGEAGVEPAPATIGLLSI